MSVHPYSRLAVRVIALALRDAADPADMRPEAESARTFLAGSSMLRLWCEVAQLNPDSVAAAGHTLARRRPITGDVHA
jgi:hypothetical protein